MEPRADDCQPCQIRVVLPFVSRARDCVRRRLMKLARLGADAHRHYDVEERRLNFHDAGAHFVN